jgi:predicted MFS family arabinose efflux permease
VANAVGMVAIALFMFAQSFLGFAVALAVLGVFRALDSGPLDSWFVDATHVAEPGADVGPGLSAGSTALGVGIAVGSALAGGLIAWDPFPGIDALVVPVGAALIVQVLLLPVTAVLMSEPPRPARTEVGARRLTAVIGSGVRLMFSSKVLLALVCVEIFWGFGMPAFESLTPVKLADQLGSADQSAALMGPVSAVGWALFAVGAWLARPLMRWLGAAASAIVFRLLQGAVVVLMGVLAGPVGLITGFLGCYLVHGTSNPLHNTLLHRQVGPDRRATVVSLNSMVSQGAGAIGTIVLTAIADGASVNTAFVVAGIALAAGAPLYLPAMRVERPRKTTSPASAGGPDQAG